MTGVITSTTEKHSLITVLQDMEYVHGQLFERTVESGCGAVTCLPGALTMLRFSALRNMANVYFADEYDDIKKEGWFSVCKCGLGEDRWLTALLMVAAQKRYEIRMCTGAFCKTAAVEGFANLVKQRRRWFQGYISNEVCMMIDIRIWKKYPVLCVVRFMQSTIRTTALLFFIMLISVATTFNKVSNLPVGFIAVSLGLNWLLMIYFGTRLKRYKAFLYPLMFLLNPFLNWIYLVTGVCGIRNPRWSGPRNDATQNDAKEAAQVAILNAEEKQTSMYPLGGQEAQMPQQAAAGMHLQPTHDIEGHFVAPERGPDGRFEIGNPGGFTSSSSSNSSSLSVAKHAPSPSPEPHPPSPLLRFSLDTSSDTNFRANSAFHELAQVNEGEIEWHQPDSAEGDIGIGGKDIGSYTGYGLRDPDLDSSNSGTIAANISGCIDNYEKERRARSKTRRSSQDISSLFYRERQTNAAGSISPPDSDEGVHQRRARRRQRTISLEELGVESLDDLRQ